MSDSSNKFLPSEDQLGPVVPIEEAIVAANRMGQDRQLVEAAKAFKAEGTVPPHAAKESARVEAVVVEKAPAGGMARRRQSAKHPPVPVLLGGRPNTDPGIAPAAHEAAVRPQTKPGLGEPEAALVATAEAEPEVPIAAVLAPPAPSQDLIEALPPDAEVRDVVAVEAQNQKAEPHLQLVASTHAAMIGDRTDRDHYPNPLAEQTPEAFQLAQQGFEREAKGFEPNKLRIAREEAKTLDPNSERYLQLAEHWLQFSVRILNDQASADRDELAVNARRAQRALEVERAEAEALERARRAPRRRLLVLAVLMLLGVAGAGAYFYRNAGEGREVPSAMPSVAGAAPIATPLPSLSTTSPSPPASSPAVATSVVTPSPTETPKQASPSARPLVVHSAAPSIPSAKPPVPSTAASSDLFEKPPR